MKFIKIILLNILVLLILLIIAEVCTCFYVIKHYNIDFKEQTLSYTFAPEYIHRINLNDYFTGNDNSLCGRSPDGLEYQTLPIILFGCSFAHGQYLEKNQTLSALISKQLKRPVYNRAVIGQGFQEMYYQSTKEDLYRDIKDTDTVIYIIIEDHYRRMYVDYFSMRDDSPMLSYSIQNGKLKMKNYNNAVCNFFKSLYLVKYIQSSFVHNYLNNLKNKDKIGDEAFLYFIKTREELEKHYNHKVKFCVFFYDYDENVNKYLAEKLQDNGFIVLLSKDATKEDLDKYKLKDGHPSAAAWQLLVNPIIKAFF